MFFQVQCKKCHVAFHIMALVAMHFRFEYSVN